MFKRFQLKVNIFLAKITNYDEIGRSFTTQYYAMFDNQATRANVANQYHVESLMKFNGTVIHGSAKIMEKIQSLTFQKITHVIGSVDCLPTNDGGILINVLGQLAAIQTQSFAQAFVLKKDPLGAWWISEDIFRLGNNV